MCRGCEGWTHDDLYMCRLCGQHANTREGIVHGAVRRGACPATRIERHPDYNDDGSRVDDLLDTTFDRAEKIFRILTTIILTVVLLGLMYGLGKLFLPSFPPVEGTLHSASLRVLWPPVRDGTANVLHKCLEWIS
jgi:hypothetical protein